MNGHFNPLANGQRIIVRGTTKAECFKNVQRKLSEDKGWKIVHPMKQHVDFAGDTYHYISLTREPKEQ